MQTNFEFLSDDEPNFDPDSDTAVDDTTRPSDNLTLSPPGAYPVCHFMRPTDGYRVGPIIVGSFAYKRFVRNGWREVQR